MSVKRKVTVPVGRNRSVGVSKRSLSSNIRSFSINSRSSDAVVKYLYEASAFDVLQQVFEALFSIGRRRFNVD